MTISSAPRSSIKTGSALVAFLVLAHFTACSSLQKEEGPRVLFETTGGRETVVILGTNDIHGALSPENMKTKDENQTPYTKGGASILASHVRILRNEFGSRLLLLDGGDEFQGSIDSNLQEGKPMVTFFNQLGLNAAAIGNHEFDFGPSDTAPEKSDVRGALKERMMEAKYPFLAANIFEKKTGKRPDFPDTQPSTILQAGNLKIGVIGLSTVDTPVTTRPDFVKDLEFRDMAKITISESEKLRKQGAQIILLLTHAGVRCEIASESGKTLRVSPVKSEGDIQSECDMKHEIPELLRRIPKGTVDAIVSGHTHTVVHHWIEGVPVIQSGTRNQYYNLLYLTYDWNQKKVLTERTRIEGPIPVCTKVFANQGNCNGDQAPPKNGRGSLITPVLHGNAIEEDSEMEALLAPTFARTREAKARIVGHSERKLEHIRVQESPLGNLITDAIRKSIDAQVCIMNQGGIRANIESGDIHYEDVFRALPFDNAVSKLDLTGKELKRFLRIAVSGARGFYPTSGVRMRVIDLKYEPWSSDLDGNGKIDPWEMDRLIEATLEDGSPIEDSKHYTVATIDFMVQGGDDMGWFMSTIPKERITMAAGPVLRDAVVSYLGEHKEGLNSEKNPLVDPEHPRLKLEGVPAKKKRQTVGKRAHHRRRK